MKIIFAFILLSCAFFNSAHANDLNSGNALLEDYHEYKDPQKASFGAGLYMGYVLGISDAFNDLLICPPKTVIANQLLLVVGNFLEANPARLHEYKGVLVKEALMEAFPCPKQ